MFRSLYALVALSLLSACSDVLLPVDGDSAAVAARVAEGSAEAYGILALLDDPATTRSLLDAEVGLDARAARSLVWHRNGPDGLHHTGDDNRYDTIASVDEQYFVGPAALARLQSYADQHGYTPGPDDFVGTWDDVDFTWRQLQQTLELANSASEADLDDRFELDRRAVNGILDGRPFAVMDELADTYFVGRAALESLQFHAGRLAGAGEWEDCDTSADCASGLVCLGELQYEGYGLFCVDEASSAGTYTQSPRIDIPDGAAAGVSDAVLIDDLLTVPVDVMITLDIDHERPEDLVVLLEDGNGQVATVWDREVEPASEMVLRVFPSDDMVNGTWTLTVIDEVDGATGVLNSWELYIVSTWD